MLRGQVSDSRNLIHSEVTCNHGILDENVFSGSDTNGRPQDLLQRHSIDKGKRAKTMQQFKGGKLKLKAKYALGRHQLRQTTRTLTCEPIIHISEN